MTANVKCGITAAKTFIARYSNSNYVNAGKTIAMSTLANAYNCMNYARLLVRAGPALGIMTYEFFL